MLRPRRIPEDVPLKIHWNNEELGSINSSDENNDSSDVVEEDEDRVSSESRSLQRQKVPEAETFLYQQQ